jgi:putative nucleotidyltransferase with HDIG domain
MLRRGEVLERFLLCLGAAVVIWSVTQGWKPPLAYRPGQVPVRDITARVHFKTVDQDATQAARRQARMNLICIYSHNPHPLRQLRENLFGRVREVVAANSLEDLGRDTWQEFLTLGGSEVGEAEDDKLESSFTAFREALVGDRDLANYREGVTSAMRLLDEQGVLATLEHDFDLDGGSQTEIRVKQTGADSQPRVNVDDVRIEGALKRLEEGLAERFGDTPLTQHTYAWLQPRLSQLSTLTLDEAATEREREMVDEEVPVKMKIHPAGKTLAAAGIPLDATTWNLLYQEHLAYVQSLSWLQELAHTAANFGMYASLYLLCGFYCLFRQRHLIQDTRTLVRILLLVVGTVLCCWIVPLQLWQIVIVPLLLFSMTVVIVYDQELALLLSAVMAALVTIGHGFGMAEFVIFVASMATAVLGLRYVRHRTKLIYVGAVTAIVALLTAVGVGILTGQAPGWPLLESAAWFGLFCFLTGFLMTGLLPFIEQLFGIQTELSLLELGDVAHPLLQELVRRAPGTYNHSINVASLAEAAAEAIGANGLLVRVGAYFHDIGKMLKPSYFIENQGQGDNRHESLVPAMSTLVIIAHVKDGADLARQHNLPRSLIDFILQHHGTTLVEYFYNRASERSVADPNSGSVDEHSYRYPGPKPQSREAAVLMLADAAESAARALSEPTPARLEGMVHDLAMKRLMDGQFDECQLTLQQLHQVERSLTKSLAAVYHGRIKYQDQQQQSA